MLYHKQDINHCPLCLQLPCPVEEERSGLEKNKIDIYTKYVFIEPLGFFTHGQQNLIIHCDGCAFQPHVELLQIQEPEHNFMMMPSEGDFHGACEYASTTPIPDFRTIVQLLNFRAPSQTIRNHPHSRFSHHMIVQLLNFRAPSQMIPSK